MRGAGGPLLCIGDLLSDVGEGDRDGAVRKAADENLHKSPSFHILDPSPVPTDLVHCFQEHYERLNESLAGTDHSWTDLTLKLCTAVETANKLIESTNSNAALISEKVKELETVVKRGDSTVAAAKALRFSLKQNQKD